MPTLTQQQIEELRKRGLSDAKIQTLAQQRGMEVTPNANFATGVVKSGMRTVAGLAELGSGIAKTLTPKQYEKYLPLPDTQKDFGGAFSDERLEYQPGEKLGGFVGDVAQFAIPGSKVAKVTKGLGPVARIGGQMLSSGTVATAQSGRVGPETGIAVGVEALAPGASRVVGWAAKPVATLVSRILKGVGSGLSGASMPQIEQLLKNPKLTQQLLSQAPRETLKKNTDDIVRGIMQIRREARQAYGKGLESLAQTDISRNALRSSLMDTMKQYGVSAKDGVIKIGRAEFTDPKNVKAATQLINRINTQRDLNGKALRKLLDDIENVAYRTATTDERLSFNAFVRDLAGAIRKGINESTPKMRQIDARFTQELQLSEATEKIFGKIEYGNLAERLGVSQKLESLFDKRGLSPEVVDAFVQRIAKSPEVFKTSEAVREIAELQMRGNTVGTNPFEIIRSFTSAVVSPKTVEYIATYTGLGVEIVKEMAEKLSPATRGAIIRGIIGDDSQNVENQPE